MLLRNLMSVAELGARAVIWVLLGLSVVSIAIVIERFLWFSRRRIDVKAIGQKLSALLRGEDLEGARALLDATPGVEAEALKDALAWYPDGHAAVAEVLSSAVKERRKSFESGLLFLGTLGNNAPFVGLFGTVLGVVTAFRELGQSSAGAMGNVMGGIAEALVATAVGILVALPAVVAYNVLQKKADDVEENVEILGALVLAHLRGRRSRSPPFEARTGPHDERAALMAGTMGRGGRRRRGMIAGINVTPLVDVVLVLLIILMVSSTYIVAQTLKVHLPRAKSTDGMADKPSIVTVVRGGEIRLDDKPVGEEELGRLLRARVDANPDLNVVVSADREVAHGDVVRVLDAAKLAGVVKFAINVQKK